MTFPRALLFAALLVLPAWAGCVGTPGSPAAVKAGEADFWARAGASHEATVLVDAKTLAFPGETRMRTARGELGLVPPDVPEAPAGAPVTSPQPGALVFEDARFDGERGTLVLTFVNGAHLIATEGTFDPRLTDARTDAGFWRSVVPSTPYIAAPCIGDDSCVDAPPIPERFRAPGMLHATPVALADAFVVHGDALVFYDAQGMGRELPNGAVLDGAARLLLYNGTRVDRLDPFNVPLGPSNDAPLTLEATSGVATVTLDGARHETRVATFSTTLRGAGSVIAARSANGYAISPLQGEAIDILTDKVPRLEAQLVALPQVLDIEGEAGSIASFEVLLVESSGGARARVSAFRIENSTSEARYLGGEPFAVTNELLRLAEEVVRAAPLAAPVTAPALVAIGIAAPLVAFGESFVEFLKAIFPPDIADVTYEPGTATRARFAIAMPSDAQDAVLVLHGANFDDARVTLRLRPT